VIDVHEFVQQDRTVVLRVIDRDGHAVAAAVVAAFAGPRTHHHREAAQEVLDARV